MHRHLVTALAALMLCSFSSAWAATKEEKREDVRKTSQEILQSLYKLQPRARAVVEKSAGYAVFSNFGMKVFVAGGGQGQGIAFDRKSGKETFMKMVEVQAGLGFGVKKFQLVWVFENRSAFDNFVNSGWEIGAQTTAAAQLNQQGAFATGAMSVSPGVWIYQIAGDGLALELTAKGTKYYKDGELN
jgi:lipid-binding SYLF domain-containing protein